jgi:hypothetical protein
MSTLCFATNLNPADLAAWVQAVGSIGAILAAIWIAREDVRRAARQAREERQALIAGMHTVGLRAQSLLTRMESGAMYQEVTAITLPDHLRDTYIAFARRDAEENHDIVAGVAMERLAAAGLVPPALSIRLAMSDLFQQLPYFSFDGNGLPEGVSLAQFRNIQTRLAIAMEHFEI